MSSRLVVALLLSIAVAGGVQSRLGRLANRSNAIGGQSGRVIEFQGEIPRVHDPVIVQENGRYYLFCTGRGVAVWSSTDLSTWKREKGAFEEGVPWTKSTIPGSNSFYWAPDVSFFNGKWHLYYSISTFGSNRSAIGLATTPTLDPSKPNFGWKDEGLVVESHKTDNWNAIDPNVVEDAQGRRWLNFGSFWGGIKLIELGPNGKPLPYAQLHSIASRPHDAASPGAIEGPFILRRGEYYYLFVSFDFCCKGVNSTYNIRVGRSKEVTGPYLDKAGQPLTAGGGTLLVSGSERWKGPGHNSIFREEERDWLVYHAYDAQNNGTPRLRVEELRWNETGWPVAASSPGND